MVQVGEELNTETGISIPRDGRIFANIVRQVLASVSSNDNSPSALQGILVNEAWDGSLRLVSADGVRLTIGYYGDRSVLERMHGDSAKPGKLLTAASLKSLVKAAQYEGEYVEEILPGEFPDFEHLIPRDYKLRAEFYRDQLYRAAAECPASLSDLRVSVTAETQQVHGHSHPGADKGLSYTWRWTAPSQGGNGSHFQFAVNPVYLAEALQSTHPWVTVSVDETRPVRAISLDTSDVLTLLMPMEVDWGR